MRVARRGGRRILGGGSGRYCGLGGEGAERCKERGGRGRGRVAWWIR